MDLPWIMIIAIATILLLYVGAKGMPHVARMDRIVDGDSVEIMYRRGPKRVRLYGVDAPEYHHQPHGRQARSVLASLLGSNRVLVIPNGVDAYGRVLCRFVTRRGSVACAMAWRGYAWGETPTTRFLATIAWIRGIGLWSDRNPQHPRIWRLAQQRHPRSMRRR